MSFFKKVSHRNFEIQIRQDMSVIYLLLTLSILVAIVFFIAFIYSVKKGQYDDSYTPSVRMLFDDELVKDKKTNLKTDTNTI
jgi:cbb3-type cytochrome oxidase maturation protein